MKKTLLFFILGLFLSESAFAENGYIYLENVNNIFGSQAKVQLKIVAKTDDGKVVKTVETDNIMAGQYVEYKLSDFGLREGNLDLYARDLDKSPNYDKCIEDSSYSDGCTVVIHGWSDSKNATCEEADDMHGNNKRK